MALAQELAKKWFPQQNSRPHYRCQQAVNEAIDRCAEVAESGGVNVADPETAARIRALKGDNA